MSLFLVSGLFLVLMTGAMGTLYFRPAPQVQSVASGPADHACDDVVASSPSIEYPPLRVIAAVPEAIDDEPPRAA